MVDLRKKTEGDARPQEKLPVPETARVAQAGSTILWVDDNPKDNRYFVEQLSRSGIRVDVALSTTEGIAKFDRGNHHCEISDMGRTEGGRYDPAADLELLRMICQKAPSHLLSFSAVVAVHKDWVKSQSP